MSFPGHLNAFLQTQIHTKSSSWGCHDTCREQVESSELLLHNDNLPTLDNLGFPSTESSEYERLRVTQTEFWILLILVGDQRVRMFSLSFLFWQFQKKES